MSVLAAELWQRGLLESGSGAVQFRACLQYTESPYAEINKTLRPADEYVSRIVWTQIQLIIDN